MSHIPIKNSTLAEANKCDYMIESRVRQIAEANGVNNSYELQKALGIAPTVAVRLWRDNVTRFSKEILEKLCTTFSCQVGDLLVFTSAKKSKGQAK